MSRSSVDLFLNGCGVTGPFRLEVQGPGQPEPRRVTLYQPFALVGRHPRADIVLDHPDVSRRHAYFQVVDGRVLCVDLESRTGLRWGEVAEPFGWLQPGRPVAVGPFRLHLIAEARHGYRLEAGPGEDFNPLARRYSGHAALPSLVLEFLTGTAKKSSWRPKGLITLMGSSTACPVHLVSPNITAFHASLVRSELGAWVVDLVGHNGIQVNGKRVRSSGLEPGDEIKIGGVIIRVGQEATLPVREPEGGRAVSSAVVPLPAPPPEGLIAGPVRSGGPVDTPPAWPVPAGLAFPSGPLVLPPQGNAPVPAGPLSGGDGSESILLPLLSQFNQMQQQLIDQFHQSMMMMAQMFGAMHRDQIELLREELDRLYQANRELQSLQAERAKITATPPALEAPQQPAAAPPLTTFAGVNGKPAAAPPPPREEPAPAPPVPAPAPSASPAPADPHAWLNQRIASIQQEQQGRWQKILGFLRGKQPKGHAP